jgi:serine/threonine-protein kinase
MHAPTLSHTARLRRKALGATAVLILLAACGGGGGGSGSGASTGAGSPPAPMASVTVITGAANEAGSADGAGASARFNNPAGITIDAAGNLYVADRLNRAVRKIAPDGRVSTLAGSPLDDVPADGPLASARFMAPTAIAIDAAGNLLVTDQLSVRKIRTDGVVSTIARVDTGQLTDPRSIQLFVLSGIAVDRDGNLYLTNGIGTRRISPAGTTTLLEGVATMDNTNGTLPFLPRGITVDASGTAYVFDLQNTVSRLDASGYLNTIAGTPGVKGTADGNGTAARFTQVAALTADSQGKLFAADVDRVRTITPAGAVTTVAGKGSTLPLPDGLNSLAGIVADGKGNLYATWGHAIIKITLP